MKRLQWKFVVVLWYLFLITSCKKDQPTGQIINSTITSNSAPSISIPNDGAYDFIISTVTTYQNFNCADSINYPQNEYFVQTISNPAGNRLNIGSISFYSRAESGPRLVYQGDTFNYSHNNSPCSGCGCSMGGSDSISMHSPISWELEIGATFSTITDSSAVPVVADLVSPDTISTGAGFIIQTSGQMSGDSVVFLIEYGGASISKVLPPTTNSCIFTAQQMASLAKTPTANIQTGENAGLVQVTAYRLFSHSFNGQKCYFLKEATFSKYVVLK
jgi:hypothetical protein